MKKLTESESRYIEGYAKALQDLQYQITGENTCVKSYDPMTVKDGGETMMSYAFNMKDGGRSHAVSDYESVEEILQVLLDEAFVDIARDSDTATHNLKAKEMEMIVEIQKLALAEVNSCPSPAYPVR